MRQAIGVFGVFLLLAGFAVAGCGDDDDGSGASGGATAGAEADSGDGQGGSSDGGSPEQLEPTSESKDDYVEKADALCKKRKQQLRAQLTKILEDPPAKGEQQAAFRKIVADAVAPELEAEAEELRALGAPEGEEGEIEELVVAIEAAVGKAREDPAKFISNPSALDEARKLAREYGIDQCGRAA